MRCPACHGPMQEQSFGDVAVDACDCGGLWLDRGELPKLDESDEGFGPALDVALAHSAGKRRTMPLRCTRCDAPMREHRYQNVPGVWIDECYGCRGFFLDAGELRAIREWIGEQQRKQRDVEALLASDPVYQAEREAMEDDRARMRETVASSKALMRPPDFTQPWAIYLILRALRIVLSRFDG
jgi:Zn-finger nucleic acid-binding protein